MPRKHKDPPRQIGTLIKLQLKYVVLGEMMICDAMDRVAEALDTALPALREAKVGRIGCEAQVTLIDEKNCKRLTGYEAPKPAAQEAADG